MRFLKRKLGVTTLRMMIRVTVGLGNPVQEVQVVQVFQVFQVVQVT